MTEIEFKWLTEPLAVLLTGKGVFIVSIVIAVIFGFIYYKNRSRQLLNSLPGLFTSLGLLGTFVAICTHPLPGRDYHRKPPERNGNAGPLSLH